MSLKFIHPTLAQVLRLTSILLAVADFVLLYASHTASLPFVPGWLAYLWPYVFGAAFVLHQAASTFGLAPDPATEADLTRIAKLVSVTVDAILAARAARPPSVIK